MPFLRRFSKSKLTLQEVVEYKKEKIKIPEKDLWSTRDKEELRIMHRNKNRSKEYYRIMDDWKNNLIRKQKRRERRIESQQTLPEIVLEDPKLILHR